MSQLFIRLGESEQSKVARAAKKAGQTISDWARSIILRAVGIEGTGERSRRNQKLEESDREAIRALASIGTTQSDLAKRYKVTAATISRIVAKKR